MKKYMINICYGNQKKREETDMQFLMQKYQEWSQKIASRVVIAHKLKDGEGRRLDLVNQEVKDGPFVETKETVGGFYIVNAENYEEACKIAEDCPTLRYQGGYVEVREVEF